MTWKAYPALILFTGLALYVALGGTIASDPDCYGRCYMDGFSELIENGYRTPLAFGLFGTGVLSFFYWKLHP